MPIRQTDIVGNYARGAQTANALTQMGQAQQDRARASRGRNALADLITGGQNPQAMNTLAQADPGTAMKYQQFQASQQQAQSERQARETALGAVRIQSLLQQGNIQGAAQEIQAMPDSPQKQQALQLLASGQVEPVAQMAGTIVEAATRGGILEAPQKEPTQPSKVREYQFARQQGYQGSYQDWLAEQDGGMALNIGPEGSVSFTTGRGSGLKPVGSTESRSLRDAEVATRNFVGTAGDALKLLQENPDINTFMGRAAGIVNDLQQEAGAFARGMGLEFDVSTLDPSKHKDTFDDLGIDNARMKSLITSLAFQAAAASGQTGRSVSDRDVQRFIREIGASSADPRAFSQVLNDLAGRTVRNFQTNLAVRTGREIQDDLGVSDLPQIGGELSDQEAQELQQLREQQGG